MKAVMYHYVREHSNNFPYFVYLHVDDFIKQIDYFQEKYNILSKQDIYDSVYNKKIINNGLILTFDDGLKDHYNYVFPALKERDIPGLFYIPTFPYFENKLLDVHRVHYLLGKYGGETVLKHLVHLLDDKVVDENERKFSQYTYTKQKIDESTKKVKQILNYYLTTDKRTEILDKLMFEFQENEKKIIKNFYLTKSEINEMHENGMIIGSHGHSHTVFSNLDYQQQEKEITVSSSYLSEIISKKLDSFCYPYGGKLSYNENTLDILDKSQIEFAFSVESRDINRLDLENKYEIPRYDCNEFPHGTARGI